MERARAIVWRHRWELAPLLLFLFTGGLQTLLLGLHSAVPFGFRRIVRFEQFSGVYIASEVDLYWLVFNLAELLLLRWGLRRVKRMDRPVTQAIWTALIFSPAASLVAGAARRIHVYFERPVDSDQYVTIYQYVPMLIVCVILMVGIAQAMRVLRGSPAPHVVFALVVLALSRSALSGLPLPFPYPLSLLYSGWVAWYAVAQYCLIFVIEALFMTWVAVLIRRIPSQPTERQWRTVKRLAAVSIAGIGFTVLSRIAPSDSGLSAFVPRWYLDFVDSPWALLDYFARPLDRLARAAVAMLIGLIVWSRVRLPAAPPLAPADQDTPAPERENA